jgi:hypothetical protein
MSATVSAVFPLSFVITITPSISDVQINGTSIKNGGTISVSLPAANANQVIGPVLVLRADGKVFTGSVTVGTTDGSPCPLVTTNNGNYPCNLAVGAANAVAGTSPLKLTVSPA